ncbi:hypothetical protein CDAR_89401 [Caerostris darwini]|uniref:Uncharacterized protein n=1 Tax=Caerostris darwini TaxID=1538125 RepID=A0AAV4N8J4_9ARAC|nr:hypothetical protein CDAR_89401 [Caerostris darwini]
MQKRKGGSINQYGSLKAVFQKEGRETPVIYFLISHYERVVFKIQPKININSASLILDWKLRSIVLGLELWPVPPAGYSYESVTEGTGTSLCGGRLARRLAADRCVPRNALRALTYITTPPPVTVAGDTSQIFHPIARRRSLHLSVTDHASIPDPYFISMVHTQRRLRKVSIKSVTSIPGVCFYLYFKALPSLEED